MDLLKSGQGDGDLGSHVEGELNVGGMSSRKSDSSEGEFNTLDEPIMQTIVSWLLSTIFLLEGILAIKGFTSLKLRYIFWIVTRPESCWSEIDGCSHA